MRLKLFLILLAINGISLYSFSQDSLRGLEKIADFPDRFVDRMNGKMASLTSQLERKSSKYLQRLIKQENKLRRKLSKIDSAGAKELFSGTTDKRYSALIQKLKSAPGTNAGTLSGEYMPYIDSLKGSLSFLNENPQLLTSSKILPADIQQSLGKLNELQAKLQGAGEIKQFIQQRKEQIKNYLSKYTHLPPGITKAYKDYTKQAYYYGQQLREYKEMLNDPDKMIKTALGLLNKVPAFTDFMKKNSMLASLFNIPGNTGSMGSSQMVTGLQTRTQVMSVIQSRFGQTGPNTTSMVSQNLQAAQGQLDVLRNKLNALGKGGGDLEMPDFKPNNQKTKSFFRRLEYGTNIQSARSDYFYPTTTDIGLSAGYKLNDKSTIGIGASYKLGWGKDIRHIVVTQEGVGIRGFLDVKLKGSFYASGGFEYNYQKPFISLQQQINEIDQWQQSGLIGISKVISLKSKVFKKTKIQALWDFLSYRQVPVSTPIKFRVGYNF